MKVGCPSSRACAMLFVAGWLAAVPAAALEPGPERLDYQVDEGLNINRFVREDGVAAHLVLRSGSDPRILIAFPAGDSGVGVWFAHRTGKVRWMLQGAPRAIQRLDGRGRGRTRHQPGPRWKRRSWGTKR